MILEEILKILKKESDQKAYTVNNKSYTYKELYKYAYKALLDDCRETMDLPNGISISDDNLSPNEIAANIFFNPFLTRPTD